MDRVRFRDLIVDAVEYVLFIALVMDEGECGRIKNPATVQAIYRNEVSPILSSVSKIEPSIYGPKTPIGRGDRTVGRGDPLPRTRRNVDDHAGLIAKFSRRRAGDALARR